MAKVGRPRRKNPALRRDHTIIVRVDQSEKMMAEWQAKEANKKISDWARERLFAGLMNVNIDRD